MFGFDFGAALNRKYDILQEHGDAALNQAIAANREAGVREALAPSQAGAETARGQAALTAAGAEATRAGAESQLYGAQARSTNLQNQPYGPSELSALHSLFRYTQTPLGVTPSVDSSSIDQSKLGFSHGTAYAEGGSRVPGKDQGKDKVHAMLRPGEAVLVPGAAEEVGRDKIAALNAKHNAMDEASGKMAKAGKGMVPTGKSERDCMGSAKVGYNRGSSNVEGCYPNVDPQGMLEKPQHFDKGTHDVQHGKSAKTPKIAPGVIQALMSMAQPSQAGSGQIPNASPAIGGQPPGRGML